MSNKRSPMKHQEQYSESSGIKASSNAVSLRGRVQIKTKQQAESFASKKRFERSAWSKKSRLVSKFGAAQGRDE